MTSGVHPIIAPPLRRAELAATLALAQDNAFGQPLDSQLRSCLLAGWMADAFGADEDVADTVYWTALLRYLGCTGHAHEVASIFGDEIAVRAQTLVHDAADPEAVLRDAVDYATRGQPAEAHPAIAEQVREVAYDWSVYNFASGCDVADMLLERLDFDAPVRAALACTFERWNGRGFPNGVAGEAIPMAMRIVHVSQDMEAIGRRFSPAKALDAVRDRRDRTYDPALADLFAARGAEWFEALDRLDPWDAVLAREPAPAAELAGAALDEALLVVADFADLKSPAMAGHSRRCAELAARSAELLGDEPGSVERLRRAALIHELGISAVPNSILDKPGSLTRTERDRVETHPLLLEQMARRSPALADLVPVAACHHERTDGRGYHRRLGADDLHPAALVLAVVDIYVGMTTDRADRPAFGDDEAAAELRRLVREGALDARATEAVLVATGAAEAGRRRARRPQYPGGLTKREVEVLRLAARGLTTREIAERLFISPKTADHHIQHVYTKIGVSTRAAAALWATQNGIIRGGSPSGRSL